MRDRPGRDDDRVVVPDDVLPPGRGPLPRHPMSRGPFTGGPVTQGRRGGVPMRFWLIGLIVAVALLLLGGSGVRGWWAHRLHDVTGGSWGADYVIGLVVGALPLVGIAAGRLGARGARRILRMFVFGAFGFCLTYLLSPSLGRFVSDSHAGRVFDQQAPGYLWGVLTSEALWLVAIAIAWWRLRRWRERQVTRRRGPA
ncbi:MAG TPA: hypothetical protein VFJ98_05235 [Mycobacteriales bacterium]|nr:hypothetical protein [Mycobacteriales bacterium]